MHYSMYSQIRQPFRARRLEPRRTNQLTNIFGLYHSTPTQPFPRGTPRLVNSAGSVYLRCRISRTRFVENRQNFIKFLKVLWIQKTHPKWSKMYHKCFSTTNQFSHVFFIRFLLNVDGCLMCFWSFFYQNGNRNRKRWFYENERLAYTKHSFSWFRDMLFEIKIDQHVN